MNSKATHPESDAPNEPLWNALVVFWGVIVIIAVACVLSSAIFGY